MREKVYHKGRSTDHPAPAAVRVIIPEVCPPGQGGYLIAPLSGPWGNHRILGGQGVNALTATPRGRGSGGAARSTPVTGCVQFRTLLIHIRIIRVPVIQDAGGGLTIRDITGHRGPDGCSIRAKMRVSKASNQHSSSRGLVVIDLVKFSRQQHLNKIG